MRGRKPLPTAIKEATGAGSHHAKSTHTEPKPGGDLGRPPTQLSKHAKQIWRSLAKRIEDMGVGTRVDREAFSMLTESYANWLDLIAAARKTGHIVKVNGQPVCNPLLKRADTEGEKVRKLLVEFGLTPSSRSRLSIADEATDDLAEFLKPPTPAPAPMQTAGAG